MILTPATLFAKIVGLFYKIPLLHIVGVAGMAYFLSAYHVYSLLFVLSASGLPTALSLLVSRAIATGRGRVSRIFGLAVLVFLLLGGVGTLLLFLFAVPIAARLSMSGAAPAIAAIAPALFLSAFVGAVRGLFQGAGDMLPTAISEVLEALGKLVFGILLALRAAKGGAPVPLVAAAAIFGITLGVALSALFLLCLLFCRARRIFACQGTERDSVGRVLRTLFSVALPITVSASVMSFVSLADTVLISGRLQAIGFAPHLANAMYSSYGNLAVPLYNLVPALLAPVTLSLTPVLSAAFARGEGEGVRTAFASAFRLCALLALPASLGLSVFAYPILSLLYVGQSEAISVATPLLMLLAPAVLLAVLIALTSAALQAAGRTGVPVLSMLVGAFVKLTSEALLLSLPQVNIFGAPISTLLCNAAVLLVNTAVLYRLIPRGTVTVKNLLSSLAASLLAVGAGACLYYYLSQFSMSPLLQMLPVLFLVAMLYLLAALLFSAVTAEDIAALPFGDRICLILLKCHLLKEVKNEQRRKNQASFGEENV